METKNTTKHPVEPAKMLRQMLLGAAIGLVVISFFIVNAGNPDPAWGKFWRIRPLVIVPLAGAAAGAIYCFLGRFRDLGKWQKAAGTILGLLVYLIALWIGIVLGLAGTLWN